MRALLISLLLTLGLDQASKYWILNVINLDERGWMQVAPPWLNFQMAWNKGVNFGLFAGVDMRWVLVALAVVVCTMVLVWVIRARAGRIAMISAGLLVGGAMGNVIDRVLYGAVVDFLNMSCCGIENPYAFNIADIGVFIGAFGLLFFGPNTDKPKDA